MEMLRLTMRPRSAFGGPIQGDTFFGQLCWAARNRWGEAHLTKLLEGYRDRDGRPFAVCSDAFPSGCLPRPALPLHRFREVPDAGRKAIKKRRWVPVDALAEPVEAWLARCRTDRDLFGAADREGTKRSWMTESPQPHNSIDRRGGTTGGNAFAPYTMTQFWYGNGILLDTYALFDPARIDRESFVDLVRDIGHIGYGRDASIGLGKFDVESAQPATFDETGEANACLTLAPCAPQGIGLDPKRCHYDVFTRFGRHGDHAVFARGGPFKTPVLLAASGGLFTGDPLRAQSFIGQGLGGDGELSKAIPETVQQGYSPFVRVRVDWGAV